MGKTNLTAPIKAASTAALLVMGAICSITPATAGAAAATADQIIADFCAGQPPTDECNDWRDNHQAWTDREYQRFYLYHWSESGFNSTEGAAAFGLTVDPGAPAQAVARPTAIVTPAATVMPAAKIMPAAPVALPRTVIPADSADDPNWVPGVQRGNIEGNRVEVIGDSDTHVADCLATFRSYDIGTDSYLAFDGTRHRCKL